VRETVIASEAKQSSVAPAGAQKNRLKLAATAALFSWRASHALIASLRSQ
jgi:hypothetical protein